MTHKTLSRQQIIALTAVFAICVSTLLVLAPGIGTETASRGQTGSDQFDMVTQSSNLADLSAGELRKLGSSEDPTGATRQVYALDRPTSGVLVTLGTAHLEAASANRPSKVITPPKAPQAPVAVQKTVPTVAPAPVQVARPAPTPQPQPASVQIEEEVVTATATPFASDEELIDTAILLGQMTKSVAPTDPRIYTVVAGDSLASIAARFYGSAQKAQWIFEANRSTLRTPDGISVGQMLVLP